MNVTGLSVSESDELQISNYGIGDYDYEHQDSLDKLDSDFYCQILLLINFFHLSDVQVGREMIFLFLNLRVHAH